MFSVKVRVFSVFSQIKICILLLNVIGLLCLNFNFVTFQASKFAIFYISNICIIQKNCVYTNS